MTTIKNNELLKKLESAKEKLLISNDYAEAASAIDEYQFYATRLYMQKLDALKEFEIKHNIELPKVY